MNKGTAWVTKQSISSGGLMFNEHRRFKSFALPFIMLAVLLPALGGCSDDDTTTVVSTSVTPSAPFTDGDGKAELTDVPVLPASLSIAATIGSTINVGIPVDSDTAKVDVYLHPVGDTNNPVAIANNQTVTPSTTATITMLIVATPTAGTVYYIELITCVSATVQCQFTFTTSANDTGYADNGSGVYNKFDMATTTVVGTGLTIPTVTAN